MIFTSFFADDMLKCSKDNINYHFLREDMITTNSTNTTLSLADLNHLVNSTLKLNLIYIYLFFANKILFQKLLNAHHAEF